MKTIKKTIATSLSMVLALSACGALASCGGGETTVNNDKTVNIKVIEQGFGVEWLYELESQFETAFASEGYEVNILEPSPDYSGETIINELYNGYEDEGVDLYITSVQPENVGAKGTYKKVLVEDIRQSVFNQPAISYDGTEETVKISEKISADIASYMCDSTGAMYAFNWAQSAAGMAVNTKKLQKYGVTELPKTTNEMFDIFEKIYLGANGQKDSETTKIFPITYFAGQNGYQVCMLMTWLAQYDPDFYNTFWKMENENGAMKTDGYEVFNNQAITEMLTLAHRTFDQNISSYGSTTQTLDQAQAALMKETSGAVFYAVGDWMLNEVKLNYRNNLHDIEFMNFPMNSALGTKLFGAGTSYNLSDEKCDEVLSLIAGLVDANKSIDEIIAEVKTALNVTISTEDAQRVATARGVYYTRGIEQTAYITKGALGKTPAEKLLRMMASEDFAETFSSLANANTPYTKTVNTKSDYKFVKQASAVAVNDYVNVISHHANGFRKDLNLTSIFITVSHIPQVISTNDDLLSIYADGKKSGNPLSVYATAAKAMQKSEYDNAKANWSTWLQAAGIK